MDDDSLIEDAELIRQGRTFAIYRTDPDGAGVSYLLKAISAQESVAHAAARLENEFAVTRGLDHPNIVCAERLSHTAKGPVLMFPSSGRTSLDHLIAGPMDPDLVRRIEDRFPAKGGAPEQAPIAPIELMWERKEAKRGTSRGILGYVAAALGGGAVVWLAAAQGLLG